MANDRRTKLHSKLEELLGSRNVYYQPPETVKMQYDAIRYSLGTPESRFANDKRYAYLTCYDLIVISRKPDPEVVQKILELPYSSLSKPFNSIILLDSDLNYQPYKVY